MERASDAGKVRDESPVGPQHAYQPTHFLCAGWRLDGLDRADLVLSRADAFCRDHMAEVLNLLISEAAFALVELEASRLEPLQDLLRICMWLSNVE